ncbi:sodium ABC transporter permease [Clostridium baratii]|uniref:Putative ABC transporter permease n=1 Tax=Clostridium baratii TaxID=1561 RepID=A0A174T388_9CLOT|nr:ABC transporter permease [Clostridium baratii]OPF50981.1 sodium ABC transporter permease [Clostridium baratii]OPF53895.1 sodium ABC transporter permease [Clostridium baratii]OPF58027.1 sodium ABC transporter permease [Clostridium baratii]OPF61516.1 sodium ABC transporter permease [Clostridium baratii]CUQ01830.1 putative ABC transporter permease [Clostridium baratii]
MKKFLTVFGFTYKETIRNKGLIISTIITLIIMAGFFNMDKIMNLFKSDSVDEIMITESGNLNLINNEFIKNLDDKSYKFVTSKDSKEVENVKKELESGDSKYVALLEVSNKAEIEGKLYVNKAPGSDLQKKVTSVLNDMKVISNMKKYKLTTEEYTSIMSPAKLEIIQKGNSSKERMVLVYALVFGIYMITLTFGSMVANSVIEEKTNRIMETLITMAKPMELFFGKVLGVCAVGLTQIVIILGAGFAMLKTSGISAESINALNLNFGVIIAFIFYFLLGYLTFSMLYAAVASLASSPQDVNSAMGGITMIFVVVFLIAMNCMGNIDTTFAKVMSYIPFASPLLIFERIILSNVGAIEIVITTLINVGFIILVGIVSSKLYKRGTLHYGRKISLIKALKGK